MSNLHRSFLIPALTLTLVMSACSNPLDSSGSDGTHYTPQPLGMEYCYSCHNVPGSDQEFEQVFSKWVVSRHSNFDYYDSISQTGIHVDPFNLGGYTYSEIEGNPSYYANTSVYPTSCSPCHMGSDDGGQVLDSNAGGALFNDPNIGEQYFGNQEFIV